MRSTGRWKDWLFLGMSEEKTADLVVIGGGITGLAAAWTAGAVGANTILLESSERFGGSVVTHREGGYKVEGGPHSLLVNELDLEEFLRETGLWEKAIESSDAAGKRFVVRNGSLAALPSSPGGFFTGSFLSVAGKARLMMEPFAHGVKPAGEEAIGPWVERHFGREVREGLADPFISGIYAGDPERISLQAAFPQMAAIAEKHPSLVRSFLRLKKERKESGEPRYSRRMMSFPDGLGEMVGHLVRKGSFDPLPGVRLRSIQRETGSDWRIRYRMGSEEEAKTIRTQSLLVAVPPHALKELPFENSIGEAIAAFGEVESPPVTTFSIAFKRKEVRHPLDGFGVLAPERERRRVLGILFDSSLFPGRAPEGEVLLSAFLGGVRSPESARHKTETFLKMVREECVELLGATGEPTYWKSTFWPRAIPQYSLGFLETVANLDKIERSNPTLSFAGNARDGVALGSCILSGVRRVKELLKRRRSITSGGKTE